MLIVINSVLIIKNINVRALSCTVHMEIMHKKIHSIKKGIQIKTLLISRS